MRLYYTPGTCSLAPHITAREAGLEIELVRVDMATRLTQDGTRFASVNPLGYVPALATGDGRILIETAAILQFLGDLRPDARLIPPAGTFARNEVQTWLNFIATELHKGFAPLWRKETPSSMRQAAKDVLATRFSYLDQRLAPGPFIMGEQFGVADAYAFTVLGWAKFMNIDLARWPHISAFIERVAARPKVREALAAEGLTPSVDAA